MIKKTDELHKNEIKFRVIGNKNLFSKKLKNILAKSEKITKDNNKLQINLAINYGSKAELINSVKQIKKFKKKITETNIENFLYTNKCPNPDLLIRTGNTRRLSNFLLWQIAYSEIYFEKKLWPDFNINDYNSILNNFRNLKLNFGAI